VANVSPTDDFYCDNDLFTKKIKIKFIPPNRLCENHLVLPKVIYSKGVFLRAYFNNLHGVSKNKLFLASFS